MATTSSSETAAAARQQLMHHIHELRALLAEVPPDAAAAAAGGVAPRTPQAAEEQDATRRQQPEPAAAADGSPLTDEQQRQRGMELLGALLPILATASKSAASLVRGSSVAAAAAGGSHASHQASAAAAAAAAAEAESEPPVSPPLSPPMYGNARGPAISRPASPEQTFPCPASPYPASPVDTVAGEIASSAGGSDEQPPPPISAVRNAAEMGYHSTALPQLSPIETFAFGDGGMPWCFQQYSAGGGLCSAGPGPQDLMQFLPVRGGSGEAALEPPQQQQQQQAPAASSAALPRRNLPLKLQPLELPESSCWLGEEEREAAEGGEEELPASMGPGSPYSPCYSALHLAADGDSYLPTHFAPQDVAAVPSVSSVPSMISSVRPVVSVPLPLSPGPMRARVSSSPSAVRQVSSHKLRPSATLSLRFTPPATPTTPMTPTTPVSSSCGFLTPTAPNTPASPFTPASPVTPATPVAAAAGEGDEAAAAAALPAQLDALLRALLLQKIAAAADAQLAQQQQQQQQEQQQQELLCSEAATATPAGSQTAAAAAATEAMGGMGQSAGGADLAVSDPLARLMESIPQDGYQWRKYGQKTAKGAKFPRAYFRCALHGCPARKTVELAEDAASTRVVYREEHSHGPAAAPAAAAAAVVANGGQLAGSLDSHLSSSSGSIGEESRQQQQQLYQKAQMLPGQGMGGLCGNKRQRESEDNSLCCPMEVEGAAQLGAPSNPCKRQKVQTSPVNTPPLSPSPSPPPPLSFPLSPATVAGGSAVTTPVPSPPPSPCGRAMSPVSPMSPMSPIHQLPIPHLQHQHQQPQQQQQQLMHRVATTKDEIDDGYRWRKYGEKALKQTNFKRSYYRCSHDGCLAKRVLERRPEDPSILLVSYRGGHSHKRPIVARIIHSHGFIRVQGPVHAIP